MINRFETCRSPRDTKIAYFSKMNKSLKFVKLFGTYVRAYFYLERIDHFTTSKKKKKPSKSCVSNVLKRLNRRKL